jgi:enoyl-CoA hydratase
VFCRHWDIPLMDGGTVRLTRLIGHSRALDMIITGHAFRCDEALAIGLANRLVPHGRALPEAIALARQIAALPQTALRSDRASSYEQWSMPLTEALAAEYRHGIETLRAGRFQDGLERYAKGQWRERSDQRTEKPS